MVDMAERRVGSRGLKVVGDLKGVETERLASRRRDPRQQI